MSDAAPVRPAWGMGALAAGLVLVGYVLTLAPTVTFWDAGEFIAASKVLGIPHPPATPLFVMIAHVWATLLPIGEWALRTNLLSATCSALAAGAWAMVAHGVMARLLPGGARTGPAALLPPATGIAAALVSGFSFTNWQNSNETEVYTIATLTIALSCLLALAWRQARGSGREGRYLLLVLYLAGLSIGNHLLALLAGPALVVFLASVVHGAPPADRDALWREGAQVAVVAGLWALLIGTGLGSTPLMTLGGLCFVAAFAFAVKVGEGAFAAMALLLGAIGVTTYAFAFVRAGQGPPINEAAPATWDALLAVIRRAQYPVRTPFDDPTQLHGPENPGRTLQLIGLQLVNYVQYLDWQWARRLAGVPRLLVTLTFVWLGLRGAFAQRRADRDGFRLLLVLWLVTGLGLVAYMNFKPGASIGYDAFPRGADHEVRERDYFFVVSFVVWSVWAAIGAGVTFGGRLLRADDARATATPGGAGLALAGLALVAAVPPLLNAKDAGRRHGPDATLAADFAWNALNSVPPYGILFTYGDNDTFPLWWAQEVAGIRRDVTVVCLALANTDWYIRQMRAWRPAPFDAASAPAIWRDAPARRPDWPLHSLDDSAVATLTSQALQLPESTTVDFGPFRHGYPAGTYFPPADLVAIKIIQENVGRRPIAWSVTTGADVLGLRAHVVQRGIGYMLEPGVAERNRVDIAQGMPVDAPFTERLVKETYRYARLREPGRPRLETTAAGMAAALAMPWTQLALAADARGARAEAIAFLEQAVALSDDAGLRRALEALRAEK
ncbi:MAG: DUF2723 domain-containing protein [Gemmatimonadales bacterium]|nr:DUF2723 domain-containing protein [Gemmatimonadales bacterium]